jgi:predicted nucleic acid-binding protein
MDSHVKATSLITAPLLASELANALCCKRDYDNDRLVEAMNDYYHLHLREPPIDAQLLSSSSEIALRREVTVYDAISVALAVLKNAKCVAADQSAQCAKL